MSVICNYYSSEPWVWPESESVLTLTAHMSLLVLAHCGDLISLTVLHWLRPGSYTAQTVSWCDTRPETSALCYHQYQLRWWYLLISSLNITININSEGFLMLTVCWWLKLTIFVPSELLDWEEWWVCDGTLPRLWSYGGQSCLSIINISASVTSRH